MKKILLFIVVLVATLGMNAQTTEIYKGTTKEATYSGADVRVEFGMSGSDRLIKVYQSTDLKGTYTGSDYKVVSKELPPSTGTALRKPGKSVKWVQLWKDGPKFAECNIGADKATDYGYYLTWGGNDNQNPAYNAGSADLSGSDDSAYNVWGPNWRMPTKEDFNSLFTNCIFKIVENYNDSGVGGLLFTGKDDYASNSVFFPAAGFYSSENGVKGNGNRGSYWSSTAINNQSAYELYFYNSSQMSVSTATRNYGYSVRPIYVEEIVDVTGVSLNKTELKVGKGNTETLSATVAPENANNKKVSWTSSDESVATVDKYGKVTGVSLGQCTITATTEDGEKTATCGVVVEIKTTGTAKARIGNEDVDVEWVQLWEGGPKFAEYNVGAASNKEEDYGGYYAWGGSQDKGDGHNTTNTGTGNLSGNDDTATNLWGSNWRMPTKAEFDELLTNCNVEWTNVGGVNGRKFTGKAEPYSSNSVFLPAPGYCLSGTVDDQDNYGFYWSSTPISNLAYLLSFSSGHQSVPYSDRSNGYSVRAVLNEPK